jgi:hypothetical protein
MIDKLYQVFVSSTYTDLMEERRAVADALAKSNFLVTGMELFPASSQGQLEFIKKLIDRCDYYVLIIAGRYGSLTNEGISYTETEYHYAKELNKPIIVFIHKDISKIENGKSENDENIRKKLHQFRENALEGRVCSFWENKEELATQVAISLPQEAMTNPQIGWIRGDQAADVAVYKEVEKLRAEIEHLRAKSIDTIYFPKGIAGPEDSTIIEFEISYYGPAKNPWETGTIISTVTVKKLFKFGELFTFLHYSFIGGKSLHELYLTDASSLVDKKTYDIQENGHVIFKAEYFLILQTQFLALDLISIENSNGYIIWTPTQKGDAYASRQKALKVS